MSTIVPQKEGAVNYHITRILSSPYFRLDLLSQLCQAPWLPIMGQTRKSVMISRLLSITYMYNRIDITYLLS
jgi:hypothetical protein